MGGSLPVWIAVVAVAAVIAVLIAAKAARNDSNSATSPGGDQPGAPTVVSGLPASLAQCDDGMNSTDKFLDAARPVVTKWDEYWNAEQEYIQNANAPGFDAQSLAAKRDAAFARIAQETKAQLDSAKSLQSALPENANPCTAVTPSTAPDYSAAITACLQRAPVTGDAAKLASDIVTAFGNEAKRQDDVASGALSAADAEKQYLPVWKVSKRGIDAFTAADDKVKKAPKCELPSAA